MKGFDEIKVFSGGEEQWQNWSSKIKTAVSGMNEEFAEMLTTAEKSIEEVLREAKFVDANRERCEGRQRDVPRAGEIHKFRGFADREERIGDGRSESTGEVPCEQQQKDVGAGARWFRGRSTGEWICRRLMARLREVGLESVDVIVKSHNEPALTSLIASWSAMRAMTSGSRMIIENSPVGSSKSNGIAERATQSVQGKIRTIRSDIEGRWGLKIDATHSILPWIAEHAGFLLTRFEVGRDGKTACERLKGKSATVQGMAFC